MSEIDYEHEIGNGWSRYQIMVLKELKRLADCQENMQRDVQELKTWQAVEEDRHDGKSKRATSKLAWAAVLIPSLAAFITSVSTLVWLAT